MHRRPAEADVYKGRAGRKQKRTKPSKYAIIREERLIYAGKRYGK